MKSSKTAHDLNNGDILTILLAKGVPLSVKDKVKALLTDETIVQHIDALMHPEGANDEVCETQDKSMEATLKYYLPDHSREFYEAVNGRKAFRVIGELLSDIRSSLKHQSPLGNMSMYLDGKGGAIDRGKDDALEAVRDLVSEKMREHCIDLGDD